MNNMPYRRPGTEAPSPTISERPPECPENWYLVAASKDITPGEVATCSLGAHEIVVVRGGENNAVYAFEAHCQHQGCHLKHAAAVKGGLRCALHHRVIRYDGAFLLPDGAVNPTLRQGTLPAREASRARWAASDSTLRTASSSDSRSRVISDSLSGGSTLRNCAISAARARS